MQSEGFFLFFFTINNKIFKDCDIIKQKLRWVLLSIRQHFTIIKCCMLHFVNSSFSSVWRTGFHLRSTHDGFTWGSEGAAGHSLKLTNTSYFTIHFFKSTSYFRIKDARWEIISSWKDSVTTRVSYTWK